MCEFLGLVADGGVVDGAADLIVQIAQVVNRPKRDADGEPLRFLAFGFRNADMGKNFQLFNVDLA